MFILNRVYKEKFVAEGGSEKKLRAAIQKFLTVFQN
jgi:hypothetical protein